MDHVTRPHPFQGQSAVRRLKFDIAYKGTKFDDSALEIFQGV